MELRKRSHKTGKGLVEICNWKELPFFSMFLNGCVHGTGAIYVHVEF